MSTETVPVVPKRNDPPAGVSVYSKSKAHEIAGKDPDFDYEYKEARDATNPGYVENYLHKQEITDGQGNFVTLDPWIPVEVKEVKQGSKRADDSAGVSTQVRHGTGILCKTPIKNRQAREWLEANRNEQSRRALVGGERTGDRFVNLRGRVALGTADDRAHDADITDMLQGA